MIVVTDEMIKTFAKQMKKIQTDFSGDTERSHVEMDDCMCTLLGILGFQEGVNVFYCADKWYA